MSTRPDTLSPYPTRFRSFPESGSRVQMTKQAHPSRTRVKIGGITRAGDAQCAVRNGADAIGLVLYPGSARAVSVAQARSLRRCAPAFVDVVALLVNAGSRDVQNIIDQVDPDLLQDRKSTRLNSSH